MIDELLAVNDWQLTEHARLMANGSLLIDNWSIATSPASVYAWVLAY
jgi:hypothetical protein